MRAGKGGTILPPHASNSKKGEEVERGLKGARGSESIPAATLLLQRPHEKIILRKSVGISAVVVLSFFSDKHAWYLPTC